MAIDLKRYTPARVALARTGHSVATAELLRFQLDHARARDAGYVELDAAAITLPHTLVRSAARDRATFLRRPDLGRTLSNESRAQLACGRYDAAIVIADGLSAPAIHHHALPLLEALLPRIADWALAPLTVALQARVALGDEIGEALGASMVVVLIGERPGLTSPDSLGIYLTWNPRRGRTDAERNCISNVRTEGVSYDLAAHKLHSLMEASRMRRLSGVALKEDAPLLLP
ncbi:MAG: Ethanolamine ammonia-lyase light chain [Candidatus Solibacter sp.]|nr:Ethanolamine ammonia-lyase light chain [Candidatus Solibacter sp.]